MSEADLVRGLEALLASVVRRELQACRQVDEWIDQFRSPLRMPDQKASRRHCSIVKRRIRRGEPGAYISPDGQQYFLTASALAEECTRELRPPAKATTDLPSPEEEEEREGYSAVMRLVGGGK